MNFKLFLIFSKKQRKYKTTYVNVRLFWENKEGQMHMHCKEGTQISNTCNLHWGFQLQTGWKGKATASALEACRFWVHVTIEEAEKTKGLVEGEAGFFGGGDDSDPLHNALSVLLPSQHVLFRHLHSYFSLLLIELCYLNAFYVKYRADLRFIFYWIWCGFNLSKVHIPSNNEWNVSRYDVQYKIY